MSQARRIKPKKQKQRKPKTVKKQSVSLNLPWGLLSIILLLGMSLGVLLTGVWQSDKTGLGSGLRVFFEEQSQKTNASDKEIEDLIKRKSIEQKRSDKDFQFYDILPDIEKVMPDDLPQTIAKRSVEKRDYYLQAASFKTHADAEKLRARLALKGYSSVTQSKNVEGKGVYYRVRLGPYSDKRKAKTVKNKLQRLGVRPLIYPVKRS